MSSSSSTLPATILVVVAIILLGIFYYLDRSADNSDLSAITETADTDSMIAKKKKYEANKSAFSHSGFDGSMQDYLGYVESGMKPDADVVSHTGFSGTGSDYAQQHRDKEITQIIKNVGDHHGFSGSMNDYAAGKFGSGYTGKSADGTKYKVANNAGDDKAANHGGFSGSMKDYEKGNYGVKASSQETGKAQSTKMPAKTDSANNASHSGYTGSMDDYLKKHQ